jgi:cell division septum initiation protein DivIVA
MSPPRAFVLSLLLGGVVSCSDEDLGRRKSEQEQRIATLKSEIKVLQLQLAAPLPAEKTVAEKTEAAKAEAKEIAELAEEKAEELAELKSRLTRATEEAENYRAKYVLKTH